jgi:hypothetical protein
MDTDVVSGYEFVNQQEIARQSMRLQYTEPRVKPNTLAGLMALVLGNVAASDQDSTNDAYRHRIVPASSISLPSIGAQVLRENGTQWKYAGIKGETFTLANNGPYFRFQANMIGSGKRETASDAFTAAIDESWLRWGDAKIYLKNTSGTPITLDTTPTQGSANLGGSEVNFSTRVLDLSITFTNNLQPEMGYRASTGLLRTNFHPSRRVASLSMKFEVDSSTEATELNYYLNQAQLAFELQVSSGVAIDSGAYYYGFSIVIPRLQLTAIPRSATQELENLEFAGQVHDDGTNPTLCAFVYDGQATYLA